MRNISLVILAILFISCDVDYKVQENYDFPIYTCKLILPQDETINFTSGGLNENWHYGQIIDDNSESFIRIKVRGGVSKFYQKKN